ncbi:MAG: NYN domain-containing protein [Gemmatimonadota bacterium]|nr:NYN domain-containing protein [Gemmatimonadota bacterium]
MNVPYTRAPHQGAFNIAGAESPHAALLIDFDNVTMGMRSDLSKELKTLLDSDVIKGKVSVQRAYADWRRYPQYIVPLSEASVDLIFAPAYGSNKKNATDIRMAIDALELIFIRPEIGTYILLTGDSDFSSLVLKLKEYGKYVIGVGIQESSSDILVQNCDEYYSYTSLTGLTKTTDLPSGGRDPWVLVKEAVDRMVKRDDVMRSDRLKQVMQEIDPAFDESSIGFSKFSKFLAEASSRGLVQLKKMENGQYEISGAKGGGGSSRGSRSRGSGRADDRGRKDRARGGRRGGRERGGRAAPEEDQASTPSSDGGDPLNEAYDLLRSTLEALREQGRDPVRDSDVKRKMLDRDRSFDETELGFGKFSLFLTQAEEHGVITIDRAENGNLQVALDDSSTGDHDDGGEVYDSAYAGGDDRPEAPSPDMTDLVDAEKGPDEGPTVIEVEPPKRGWFGLRLGPRRGSTRRRSDEVTLLEGQTVTSSPEPAPATVSTTGSDPAPFLGSEGEPPSRSPAHSTGAPTEAPVSAPPATTAEGTSPSSDRNGGSSTRGSGSLDDLALPSDEGAIVRYLAHRYKGVGEKTAETLVEHFGTDLFRTLHEDADAIARVVPQNRAEKVIDAWRADYERRTRSR